MLKHVKVYWDTSGGTEADINANALVGIAFNNLFSGLSFFITLAPGT